jgi:hypothetical protein
MKYEFGVTLATDLKLEALSRAGDFPFVHVIDTRTGKNGKAHLISELVYRRLKNFFVDFDQIPVELDAVTSRQENDLVRCMTEPAGQILVLTNDTTAILALCNDCNIPVSSVISSEVAGYNRTVGQVAEQVEIAA